jgi:hypothetical protein
MKLDIALHGDLTPFNDIIKDAGMSLTDDQTEIRSTYESLLCAKSKLEVARKGLDPEIVATLTCSVCMCIAVDPVVPVCLVDRACHCATVMCQECAAPWIERRNTCPTCRTPVLTISPNVPLQHLMNRLRMCCWKCNANCMSIEELTEHMRSHEEDEKAFITSRILRRVCEMRSEDIQKLQKRMDEMELSQASKLVMVATLQKQLCEERSRTKELKRNLRQHGQDILAATKDDDAALAPFALKSWTTPPIVSSVCLDDDPIELWDSSPSAHRSRSRSPHRNSQPPRMRHVPVGSRRSLHPRAPSCNNSRV